MKELREESTDDHEFLKGINRLNIMLTERKQQAEKLIWKGSYDKNEEARKAIDKQVKAMEVMFEEIRQLAEELVYDELEMFEDWLDEKERDVDIISDEEARKVLRALKDMRLKMEDCKLEGKMDEWRGLDTRFGVLEAALKKKLKIQPVKGEEIETPKRSRVVSNDYCCLRTPFWS